MTDSKVPGQRVRDVEHHAAEEEPVVLEHFKAAGLDFRTAHHVAGAVVRVSMDAGLGAHEARLEMVDRATQAEVGRASGLSGEAIGQALDPTLSVASRTVPGGPALAEVRRMAGWRWM